MSMDIRSFFTTIHKKTGTSPKIEEKKKSSSGKNTSKKRLKSADSSIDDIILETPDVKKKSKKVKKDKPEVKRRRITVVSDSDSDEDKSTIKSKSQNTAITKSKNDSNNTESVIISGSDSDKEEIKERKLGTTKNIKNFKKPDIKSKDKKIEVEHKAKKVVNPFDVFGNEPVKQTKIEKPKNLNTEFNIHDDDDFDKTLLELDEEQLVQSTPNKSSSKEKSIRNPGTESNLEKNDKPNDDKIEIKDSKNEYKKTNPDISVEKKTNYSNNEEKRTKTPRKEKQSPLKSIESPATSTSSSTPSRKRKISEADDSGVNQDLERYEKKKYSSMLYQKFLNRSGPAHLGSKWIPKGKDNCLKDESFIITGVLDSLKREDAENLIVEHGGRCVKALSGKTKYMVLGEDAGPSKLEKAQKFGTKILSEDELIDLICTRSGIKNKNKSSDTKTNENEEEEKANSFTDKFSEKTKDDIPNNKNKKINLGNLKKDSGENNSSNRTQAVKKVKVIEKEQISANAEDEIPEVTVKKEPVIKTNSFYGSSNSKSEKPSTSTDIKKIEKVSKQISEDQLAWVDKYRPTEMKQIIGQQTENSNAKKLMIWLKNWYKNHDGKTKLVKPSPWAKNDNGAYFKAALLSGPPGVGKTTTSNVISRELGFDVVEFNASDTRSKKMLNEEVSQLLKTRSLAGYFTNGSAPTNKHVLLMDEVDGMSGNEDRGGMQELISLIKDSSIPIICMCNDRQHPKVRSLANYCFDLRFNKPRLEQIKGAMMSVCFKEDIKISPDALNEVILGSGMDIRQILNNLSMWSSKDNSISKDEAKKEASIATKDVKIGPWEVIRKVFSEEDHKNMSTSDKYGLFFYDYSINPLFVQENYLQVKPHCPSNEVLKRVAYAADSISLGDLVDSKIRSNQSWGLLDTQALFSSVIPGDCMEGHMAGQINFPGWLGKNSKANKFKRMLSELQAHMRTSISGSRTAVNLDYLSHIYNALVTPLVKEGLDGIPKALAVMQEYHLMREDLTNIAELVHWPKSKDLFKNVEPKVKAAFTRAYNKDVILPYAVSAVPIKKRKAGGEEEEIYGDEDDEESSTEENDNIDNNPMIKVKKQISKTEGKTKGKETKSKETKAKAPSKPRSKRGK